MKSIDIKSLIIGALLTSTIFLGVAATGTTDKWDDKQEWLIAGRNDLHDMGLLDYSYTIKVDFKNVRMDKITGGWEPFVDKSWFRKRIK